MLHAACCVAMATRGSASQSAVKRQESPSSMHARVWHARVLGVIAARFSSSLASTGAGIDRNCTSGSVITLSQGREEGTRKGVCGASPSLGCPMVFASTSVCSFVTATRTIAGHCWASGAQLI